jgi:DNA-binding NarL/FixJ family response regulator
MNKTRILIADDHAIVRMGLNLLLAAEKDFEVVGEAHDGVQALTACAKLKPDVIVLDLMMPKKDGVAVTEELKEISPETKIVILTSFGSAEGLSKALQCGAGGIVLKSSAETELVTAIRKVLDGKQHLTAGLRNQLKLRLPTVTLTDRQENILRSVMEGLSNSDIARKHGLAEITVKNHLSAIFNKLGVSNRSEAVAIALRKHLLKI